MIRRPLVSQRKPFVRLLWQHDPAEPIGRWLSLAEDRHGLRVTGRLSPDVRRARELMALLREGALDGLSIGFRVIAARPERGGRALLALDLWEISLVTFPLQPGARVLSRATADLAANLHAQARRMRLPPRSLLPLVGRRREVGVAPPAATQPS